MLDVAMRWKASPLVLLLLTGCPQSITEMGMGTGGATTTGSPTTTATTSSTSTTTSSSTSTSSTATSTGSSTTSTGGCGGITCMAAQLCVIPGCKHVLGEECIFGTPDAGEWSCPPGTKRGPQFDLDCVQPGYACVDGCPSAPPFCVDLPAACGGVPTCACLASDPCHPSNSGVCHDADIVGSALTCSLMP